MAKNNNTLVFNGLMQGMSWDLIKEAKEEIQRHLGEKQPTRKDILTDWIIGKDYMLQLLGNSYQLGGGLNSLNKDLNPNNLGLYALQLSINSDSETDSNTGNNNNSSSLNTIDFGFGMTEGINSVVAPVVGGIANSLNYNDYWGSNSAINKAAYGDSASDPILRSVEDISGTGLKRAEEEIENRRQGNILNLNYGDNASLMAQIDAYNRSKAGRFSKLGSPSGGGLFVDFLNSAGLGALHGTTFAPGWGTLIGAAAGALAWTGNAITESKNREKLNRLIEDANNDLIRNDLRIAYTASNNQLLNTFNQLQHMTSKGGKLNRAHRFAEGGLLNTYDYGLEEVNAGGSHEENPNEGVVVSYAPDGLPNKVEEGETIHNDYVYSKRLEANKKVLENNLLDEKYEGKSFADISKKLTEDRKQRPNDPISVRTNEENLARLQGALEELKLDNKTREVKKFLGSLNNDLLNALQQEMMDEYEAYAEQLAQQQDAENLAYQEEQAALEGMFGKGGHLKQGTYGDSSLSEVRSSISELRPVYDVEGNTVGWKNPDYNSNEKVLNISGYNPNYEGALIYADNRNWFLRNIASPWNTWWNNLPSQEFSWAVRNLTPIGIADAAINGDTEALLEGALFSGLLGKAKKASKVADKTDDALRLMLEAQLGGNTTKEVTKEAAKNSSKWLKSLGIGVGAIGLPLAGFYITDIEKNKDKYDLKALERGRSIGDTIVGDWQFKGDTVINTKTGEKLYSKGGHLFLGGGGFAPYEFEEVNGEVFAHRNVNRNGNIVTLTIPEAEFTPEMVTAYGIWKQRNNSNNSNVSTKNTPVRPKSTSTPKSTTTSPNNPNYTGLDYMPDSTPVNVELPLGYILDINPNLFGEFNSDEIVDSNSDFIDYSSRPKANPLNSALNGKTTSPPRNLELKPNYLSYLRYAPILGSLGLVLSDTLGLTNQPDYSNIDMYRRAVDSIGGINFVPIGGYLLFTPIDREYIANQQLAQAASYNRSLNNVNPVGSYILGLINAAKVRDQIGNMYINVAAQDEKDRLAVAEYNRGIDITNARNSLAAQSENARLRALRANEYQKIATMRDNERNIAEAARAANYDKFITNIGNLGKEEFAFNLVDSNAALLGYYTDRTGRARYRMPAFIKPDGFEAYKQYLKSHGVDESQIDA